MKKTIIALLVAASFALGASKVAIIGNVGQSIPVMGLNNTPVVIDSSEIDTSDVYFDLTEFPFFRYNDTIGTVWMRCDDSTGTDSVAGLLKWQGNPNLGGGSAPTGLWENIDSVAIAVASGVETQTKKPVVINNQYKSVRFILRNQLAPDAAKKSICRDIKLNRPKRAFIVQ